MDFRQENVGRVVRRLREEKGLSQEVLSGFAVISRSHLSDIEHGKRNFQLETLWKLSHALDIRPSELVRMIEEEIEHEKV